MPTLSELAKTSQQTTVGNAQSGQTGSAGATNIQATKQIDNSAGLTKDIGKMFGGLLQEHQEASEYAGKRVGTDNLVQLKLDMEAVETSYATKGNLTSADMAEKTRLEQGLYEDYMQRGTFGDNPLANQAFRDTYAVPATDMLFRQKTANAKNRMTLFQNEEKVAISDEIKVLGSDISKDSVASYKDRFRDVNLNPANVDVLVMGRLDDLLTVEVNDNKDKYYDAGGNVKQESMDAELNSIYSIYADSENVDIQASIDTSLKAGKAYVTQQANSVRSKYTAEAMNIGRALTWDGKPYTDGNGVRHEFAPTPTYYENAIKENFSLMNTSDHTKVMNVYKEAKNSGSNAFATKWHEFGAKQFIDENSQGEVFNPVKWQETKAWGDMLIASGNLTEKEAVRMKGTIDDIDRIQNNTVRIREELNTLTIPDAQKHLTKGGEINGWKVSKDDYKKQYSKRMGEYENVATDIDVGVEGGQAAFTQQLAKVDKMKKILNTKSPLFQQYEDNFSYIGGGTKTVGEISQTVAYYEYARASGDTSMDYYEPKISQLKQILATEGVEPSVKEARANSYLQNMAIDVTGRKNNKQTLKFFNESVANIAEGGGAFLTFIDTPVPTNTDQHMLNVYGGHRDEEAVKNYVESYEYYDSGFGGFDEYRVAVPKGLSKQQFGGYVDSIVRTFNKDANTNIDTDDLQYEVGDDGKALSYRVSITVAGRVRHIGNINVGGYQLVKGRE